MFGRFFQRLKRPRLTEHQLHTLTAVAGLVVAAVEKPGVSGPAKKEQALQVVGSLAKQLDLPVPDVLVDVAIEAAVRSLPKGGQRA